MPRFDTKPIWSPYDFNDKELEALAPQVVELAARLGFEIPLECVTYARLSNTTALCTQRRIKYPERESKNYYLYSMQNRQSPEDPVLLKESFVDKLLTDLHEDRWQVLRDQAIHDALRNQTVLGGKHEERDKHYDTSALGRWARAISAMGRAIKHTEGYDHLVGYKIIVNTTLQIKDGILTVGNNSITLPMGLPETLKSGMVMKRLRELVELPSCGDKQIDAEVGDLLILKIEDRVKNDKPYTLLQMTGFDTKPMVPNDSIWRRLRSYRPFCHRIPPEFEKTDIEAEAARYHAEIAELIGQKTSLPIPWNM